MILKIVNYICLPILIIFIAFSSIWLNLSKHPALLVTTGVLFFVSVYIDKKQSRYSLYIALLQIFLLGLFHWLSQLNWCHSLYIIILLRIIFRFVRIYNALLLAFSFNALYSIIRLSYSPPSSYTLLVTGMDMITTFLIVLGVHYLINLERDKVLLKEEKKQEQINFRNEKLMVAGELAAGMAHEIRNPLTSIKGFVQISASKNYNIEPWYELIMNEIARMNELTAEFLQFSKNQSTSLQPYNLHQCLLKVVSLVNSEALRLGHQIHYSEYDEDVIVLMDKDKITQVFVNIVKNALEAMTNSGKVIIQMYKDTNKVIIKITDTGVGIPPSTIQQIYNPFFTTKPNGTGLGLSICHKIIQDHNGSIEVSSFEDQGTCFTVILCIT